MAREDNLKPVRTTEEARALGSKGGQAFARNKKARKTLREELLALLEKGDIQENITLALLAKAENGDTKAYEIIRDTVGEKPIDKIVTAVVPSDAINDVESYIDGTD